MKLQIKKHGEVIFFEIESLPKDAQKYNPKKTEIINGLLIVGESETSGNHHVLEVANKVEVYELNGVMYLKVNENTQVKCLHKSRHDDMVLNKGIYKRKIAKEFDYFTMSKINVRD